MTVRRRWDASSTDVQAHDLKFRRVHGTAFPGQHLPLKGMWIGPAGAPFSLGVGDLAFTGARVSFPRVVPLVLTFKPLTPFVSPSL